MNHPQRIIAYLRVLLVSIASFIVIEHSAFAQNLPDGVERIGPNMFRRTSDGAIAFIHYPKDPDLFRSRLRIFLEHQSRRVVGVYTHGWGEGVAEGVPMGGNPHINAWQVARAAEEVNAEAIVYFTPCWGGRAGGLADQARSLVRLRPRPTIGLMTRFADARLPLTRGRSWALGARRGASYLARGLSGDGGMARMTGQEVMQVLRTGDLPSAQRVVVPSDVNMAEALSFEPELLDAVKTPGGVSAGRIRRSVERSVGRGKRASASIEGWGRAAGWFALGLLLSKNEEHRAAMEAISERLDPVLNRDVPVWKIGGTVTVTVNPAGMLNAPAEMVDKVTDLVPGVPRVKSWWESVPTFRWPWSPNDERYVCRWR